MGGHSSPKPEPTVTTPQVEMPNIDVAQVAAEKALAAQGNVVAAQSAEDQKKKPAPNLGTAGPKPVTPAASTVANQAGDMSQSAVLTG